jgi:two-component system response regulator GlrR
VDVSRCRPGDWRSLKAPTSPQLFVPIVLEPGEEWFGFFRDLDTRAARAPVLAILSERAGIDLLAAAADSADDFIIWGAERAGELHARIKRLLGPAESSASTSEWLTQTVALAKLVGRDPAFLATVSKIPIVAQNEGVVLILGETGTGKELVARAIHHMSARRQQPFIPVDCAALPGHLLENELFGHVRGSYTDAHSDQRGLVAMAEAGTLFLDEIDSLALPVQAKLLRLIEEKTYKPLGG